jgi:hypothetical protein
MLLQKNLDKKNFISFGIKNELYLEKMRNSFILLKLKKIFVKWDINFFKLINLRKKKIKITKLNVSKNTYFFFFFKLKKLNYFFNFNKEGINNNINFFEINYNGFYLNYQFLKRWNFSNLFFGKVFFNFFFDLLLSLLLKFIYILLCKFLFFLRFNFIILKIKN